MSFDENDIIDWVMRGGMPENRGKYFLRFDSAQQEHIIETEKNISILQEIFKKTIDKIRVKILSKVLNDESFDDIEGMLRTAASHGFIYTLPKKVQENGIYTTLPKKVQEKWSMNIIL